MKKIKANGDWIIFKNEKEDSVKKSNFYIPEKAMEKVNLKKVVSVGENVKNIKEGDLIIIDIGYEFDDRKDVDIFKNVVKFIFDGEEYFGVKVENVIGYLKEI